MLNENAFDVLRPNYQAWQVQLREEVFHICGKDFASGLVLETIMGWRANMAYRMAVDLPAKTHFSADWDISKEVEGAFDIEISLASLVSCMGILTARQCEKAVKNLRKLGFIILVPQLPKQEVTFCIRLNTPAIQTAVGALAL